MPTKGPFALGDPGSSSQIDVSGWITRASGVDGWGFWVGLGRKA